MAESASNTVPANVAAKVKAGHTIRRPR